MWFWFSLIALICWSGSDLFSKIGCQDADDKYSHLKMVMAVGVAFGGGRRRNGWLGRSIFNSVVYIITNQ